ncbi:MAG: DNA polymerase II [Lentisphaeria bacterium]|nr:DNA polymerase II [Lentisphaeria bacterium]
MTQDSIDLGSLVSSCHTRLVAAEPGLDGTATLYRRLEDGEVVSETVPFHPYLLVSGEDLAATLEGTVSVVPLSGKHQHRVRVHFPDWKSYDTGVKSLRKSTGMNPSSPMAPYRVFSDLGQQLLTMLPARLFRAMDFADMRRMQIDIETLTATGYDFPNAKREEDAICIIAMRDSTGWEACLSGAEMPEADLLREMVRLVGERDPDVIEGHNIFNFDLPYIETRCKRHKVKLLLGRDGSRAKSRSSRFSAGERIVSYTRCDVRGRHIIDTYQLVQLYDIVHRNLESYGLKNVATHFGVAAPERTYVAGGDISRVFHEDPKRLCEYAMDDVRETDAISALLSPSHFYQAQLVPFSYQNVVARGNATRIDALLTSEYMLENASLPSPQAPRPFQGALTGSLNTGVFENVWHADVRSLYPSIIISRDLCPRADGLRVFSKLLSGLREYRLHAKDAARRAEGGDRERLDALQSTFKILINSFYGYTGFSWGTFNDYDVAESVTAEGRRILQSMLDFLTGQNATVIEMDTDGLYFVPPSGMEDTNEMARNIQSILPEGIEIDLDATYGAMFGYKAKNYALLDHEGRVSITGAALKSRGIERFQRDYIKQLITLLLTGRGTEANALFSQCESDIETHRLPLADLAKREVLSTSPKVYKEKLEAGKTRRSAAYELVLNAEREYRQGDQVSFYVTGTKKSVAVSDAGKLLGDAVPGERDENVPYYLNKLVKLHKKFAEFIP